LGLKGAEKEADNLAAELENQLNGFDERLQKELGGLLEKYLYRHKTVEK
jgi:hypothetical protein